MNSIQFCQKCLYPSNHPLHIAFTKEGICYGCMIHQEKDVIDWNQKLLQLKNLVEPYRNSTNYDCIVPVCGGKDTFFTLHIVKKVLKLNPLLVSYNRWYNTPLGIRNLENLRTYFGCDITTLTLKEENIKTIIQETLKIMGSMHWCCLAGSTVFPVQMAVKLKVPLIIWGAHQGIDQVGMFSHLDEVEMTRRYRREHDLMGFEAEDLVNKTKVLKEELLKPYFYPSDRELEKTGVRGIYLNNYLRWDSKAQHEDMIRTYGYLSAEQCRTFDSYNDVHCEHYSGIHDYIKFCKFGFGKVVDHACREIRLKRLSRQAAIKRVLEYQNKIPVDADRFLNWIGWSMLEFQQVIDEHRDPLAWGRDKNASWQIKSSFLDRSKDISQYVQAEEKYFDHCEFIVNTKCSDTESQKDYPLMLKGHSDSEEYRKITGQETSEDWHPNKYKSEAYV